MHRIPPVMESLTHSARTKQVAKGQVLLYVGDEVHDIYILKTGIVKMYDIDEYGNEKILHLFKSYALLPLALFSGDTSHIRWFYSTVTDCEFWVVPRKEFMAAFQRDPDLASHAMQWFSSEVHEILTRLSSLGKTTARDKLLAALKFLAVWHSDVKSRGWRRVTFPISHQLLADMAGITRESTATVMKELQTEKLIRNPRQAVLEIHYDKFVNETSD